MILDLGRCALWIEVPLLAHDFTERLATVRRPAQHILLCTFAAALNEMQQYPPELGDDRLSKRGNASFQAYLDKTMIAYHLLLRHLH